MPEGWHDVKRIVFAGKVTQRYQMSNTEAVEISEEEDYFDGDSLEPTERVVKVTLEFPSNFFKPVTHTTTLVVSPIAPTGPVGGSAAVSAPAVPNDKHAAFEEDADEVVKSGDGKTLWWYKN